MTYQYRLRQWSGLTKEHSELGMSIRAYCAMKGFAENTYFYWQRRLRQAACTELAKRSDGTEAGVVPNGWTQLSVAKAESRGATLTIEISGCRVEVSAKTDPELLVEVCRTLKSL